MEISQTKNVKSLLTQFRAELAVGILFLLSYVPIYAWMWDRWFAKDSYYSHGILVPFVVLYLIWQKRQELARIPLSSSPSGFPLVVAGLILYLASSFLRVYSSAGLSLVMVLVGLVLHFAGAAFLRCLAFPVAFLLFMIPLPLVVIVNISFKMKLFAAQLAALVLNNIGLPAVRQGSILYLRHTEVVVEDVCSGLRSLISLAALGSIFAYWLKGPIWKRFALFLMTVPIAVVTNVCRIVFLAAVSEIWGGPAASGFVHDLSGFLVFVLAFLLLWAVSQIIE